MTGQVVRQELVTVVRDGRQVVGISKEATPRSQTNALGEWEKSVAALPPELQVEAVTGSGSYRPVFRLGRTGTWTETRRVLREDG